jgi:hypothetical protein
MLCDDLKSNTKIVGLQDFDMKAVMSRVVSREPFGLILQLIVVLYIQSLICLHGVVLN